MLDNIRRWMAEWLAPRVAVPAVASVRAAPAQEHEVAYAFGVDAEKNLVWYAMNNWVNVAVSQVAQAAASAPLQVHRRKELGGLQEDHPLLNLLGEYGKPNDYQDSLEFWEDHFGDLLLAGNAFWCWSSRGGGAPDEVYVLDARQMRIVPGRTQTIASYEYRVNGHVVSLSPEQVTHFKLYNPFNKYYGLSKLEALRRELLSDFNMVNWNKNFFDDSFLPTGIVIVPETTADAEIARIEAELEATHQHRRRTAVMRAPVGGTAYIDAGAKHRDIDFTEGRKLSRQAVYEALGLPLGMISEASTEAHARVAERRFLAGIHDLHERTQRKLNSDALMFWPGANRYYARFKDVRVADWQAEAIKLNALGKYLTRNEIRTQHLGVPADDVEEQNAALKDAQQQADRRDTGAVQSGGRTQDDLQKRADRLAS